MADKAFSAEYIKSLPSNMQDQVDQLQRQIDTLVQQRKDQGAFLDIKNESSKLLDLQRQIKDAQGVLKGINDSMATAGQAIYDKSIDMAQKQVDVLLNDANKIKSNIVQQKSLLDIRSTELDKRELVLNNKESILNSKQSVLEQRDNDFKQKIQDTISNLAALV